MYIIYIYISQCIHNINIIWVYIQYIYATVDQSFLRIQCWLCPCFVSTKNIRKQFTLLLFLRNCNAWISEAMSLLFLSQRQYSKVFRTSVDYDLGETCGGAETLMAHGILKTIALLSDPVSFCQFQCHIPCFELTWLMWLTRLLWLPCPMAQDSLSFCSRARSSWDSYE